jgi:hypothetical protein
MPLPSSGPQEFTCDSHQECHMSIQFSPIPRYSSHGRPRRVTNAMIADILAWHAQRLTAKEKADSLGVSATTQLREAHLI